MIKLHTAFTKEIDNTEKAVQEICEQLNLKENQLKNSVGIVHFYYECIETGLYKAISEALPFEIFGCVTAYLASSKGYGDIGLTLTMFTSDDVDFSFYTVENMNNKTPEEISNEITEICNKMSEKEIPKLAITTMPPMHHYSGDNLVAVVNAFKKPIKLFGTLAYYLGEEEFYSHMIFNERLTIDTLIFLAIHGNVEPQFHVGSSFAFDTPKSEPAIVTDAEGAVLKTVNNITALEYLKQQEILTAEKTITGSTIWALPAILTYPNGTKVVRAFIALIEGTEYVLATGGMENGATISFSVLDGEKTIASAEKIINELNQQKVNDAILYSCGARAWSLGANHAGEAKKIEEAAIAYKQNHNVTLNYSVAYSGGEICPVLDNEGKFINTLHNYTLIACTFNKLD